MLDLIYMNYAVIMAGGTGTRLWPLSRKNKPKQFQSLISKKTLLQETYDRIKKILPDKQIFISSTPEYEAEILKQLPSLPKKNCILEPSSRNTTAAHGFIALHLLRIDPDAVFTTLPSDHSIKDVDAFVKATNASFAAIAKYPKSLVTLGITPTSPETGLGYIKLGAEFDTIDKEKFYKIDAFIEKPDLQTAKKYVSDWGYLWNSANYMARADVMMTWIKKYRPNTYKILEKIDQLIKKNNKDSKIKDLYETIEKEQLADSVIKQPDMKSLVIPVNLGWSDIGNWGSIFDLISKTKKQNLVTKGTVIDNESQDCLVFADKKPIAIHGLKNIVIVDSPDFLLVTTREKSRDIKKMLPKIDKKYL